MNKIRLQRFIHMRFKLYKKFIFFAASTLLAVLPPAALADSPTRAAHAVCTEKSGGVTSAMLDCIATEMVWQDARLNKAYKAALAPLSAQRKK